MQHILIAGAGAAGLMAGRILSRQGFRVTFLEARARCGGRIHTLHEGPFSIAAELGAEFVHGELETTLNLLKEAGITANKLEGELWHYREGRFHQDEDYTEHWPLLIEKLQALQEDCSIQAFLDREFADDQYREMRRSVIRFTEGYDAADAAEVSTFSLREEWAGEDEDQYRVEGGYGRMIKFLEEQCRKNGATFHFSAVVKEIVWERGKVNVTTENAGSFEGHKLIMTIPVNLLDTIRFTPAIPAYVAAAGNIGFGQVIKFLLQFREDFWKTTNVAQLDKLHMLLSDEEIPTWWTQYPAGSALLTGWIGGPKAKAMNGLGKATLLDKAMGSLSRIFDQPKEVLQQHLDHYEIADWSSHPFSGYAYSYEKVTTSSSIPTLITPLEGAVYFAGEALYEGPAKGTVEAALCSGRETADKIMQEE